MKNIYLLIITVVLGLLVSSCSLQKRHYMKGYHAERNSNAEQNIAKQSVSEERQKAALAAALDSDNLTASLRGGDEFLPAKSPAIVDGTELARSQILPPPQCDTIVQKNGVKIGAKVIETASDLIKYKDCDLPDGPIFTLKQSQVESIKYLDGTSEIFLPESKDEISVTYADSKSQQEVEDLADYSITLGLLAFIPFWGILSGIEAIKTGTKASKLYKQSGLNDPKLKRKAARGKALGIIGILFWPCLAVVAVVLWFIGV